MGFQDVGEAYLMTMHQDAPVGPWPATVDLAMALSKITSLAERRALTHGLEVAVVAGTLATRLLSTGRESQGVMLGALLHDVGLLPLLSGLSPKEETALADHPQVIAAGQTSMIPGLAAHITLPQAIQRILHLDQEVADWIAQHHAFIDGSGLNARDAHHPPPLPANIIAFADTLLSQIPHTANAAKRWEDWQRAVPALGPNRFYPEILSACRDAFATIEDVKCLDPRHVAAAFGSLYPASPEAVKVSGLGLLEFSRWVGCQVDARQSCTRDEAVMTAELMVNMGKALHLPMDEIGQLALAGLLHDVGKIVIPLEHLGSERSFHGADKAALERHATVMEEIVSAIPGCEALGLWLGAHHESLNGSGYPYGRRRQDIPVGARMLAIADTYVALTRPRPFRPVAYRPQDALEILRKQQGRIFDPPLLTLLENIVVRKG